MLATQSLVERRGEIFSLSERVTFKLNMVINFAAGPAKLPDEVIDL